MDRLFSRPMPDWSDRAAVGQFAAAGAEILGDDPAAARATAQRIWDRTPGTLERGQPLDRHEVDQLDRLLGDDRSARRSRRRRCAPAGCLS
jgi:hypothetical protein